MTRPTVPSRRFSGRRRALLAATVLCVATAGLIVSPAEIVPALADQSCPAVHVSVSPGGWSAVAGGVRYRNLTVATSHGSVAVHEVDADLGAPGVGVRQSAANATTSAYQVASSVSRLKGVAGINGDFFHVTTDGTSLSADGNVGSDSGPIKGWAAATPALSIAAGRASVGSVHLVGSLTITQQSAAAPAIAHLETGTTAAADQATPSTPKPATKPGKTTKKAAGKKPTAHKKAKKTTHKRAKKKRRRRSSANGSASATPWPPPRHRERPRRPPATPPPRRRP